MNSVSHMACFSISLQGVFIQRCCICGDKLLDSRTDTIPDNSIRDCASKKTYKGYIPGMWVRHRDGVKYQLTSRDMPEDNCLNLVEV